jgi:hypothetical protein
MKRRQSGVALAVALILLVVLTLLALSGVRLSTMELRMAANDELRVAAFEQAQSLVDVAIRPFNNTPVLSEGTLICARDTAQLDCDTSRTVSVAVSPTLAADVAAGYANVVIRSIPPLNADPPVGTGYSLDKFDAAYLRVEGIFDKNAIAAGSRGAAQVNEGVAIVYGSAGEITTKSGTGAQSQLEGTN